MHDMNVVPSSRVEYSVQVNLIDTIDALYQDSSVKTKIILKKLSADRTLRSCFLHLARNAPCRESYGQLK